MDNGLRIHSCQNLEEIRIVSDSLHLEGSWCFLDVDDCLIETKDPIFHWINRTAYKSFKQECIKDERLFPYIDNLLSFDTAQLMDPGIPNWVQYLQNNCDFVMSLTAAMSGFFEEGKSDAITQRHETLCRFGIDFSISSVSNEEVVFKNLGEKNNAYAMSRDGQVFCNLMNKGIVIYEFLSYSLKTKSIFPSKLLILDDKHENLKDIYEAVLLFNSQNNMSISCFLLHYTEKLNSKRQICSKEDYLKSYYSYEESAKNCFLRRTKE